jgi:asparagine synthase (glutamine-hydrolysing)
MELPYYHLPKLDRTMMFSTIELRAPFLSPRVIAYALNLPYEKRNGVKHELKEVFADLLPDDILDRDKHPLKTDAIRIEPMAVRNRNEAIWRMIYGM